MLSLKKDLPNSMANDPETDEVLFTEISGKNNCLAVITLNRPKALNALSYSMLLNIYEKLQEWANKDNIHAVVIRGNGQRAFCAGGDIKAIYELGQNNLQQAEIFFQNEYKLNNFISNYPKPYIALIHGVTMGGGMGISIHGSYRIAAENTILAMPETGIGFFPDIGASFFLSRLPGMLGLYLGLTGNRLNIADALYTGLIDYKILFTEFDNLITELSNTRSENIHTLLQSISTPEKKTTELNELTSELKQYKEIINSIFSKNSIKEILQSLQDNSNPWCEKVYKTLLEKSPTSLAVTYKQITQAKYLNLTECLNLDLRLAKIFLQKQDFYTGIKAVVIDKTKIPAWQQDFNVETYFK
jgi:enoyl-CoA hydratase